MSDTLPLGVTVSGDEVLIRAAALFDDDRITGYNAGLVDLVCAVFGMETTPQVTDAVANFLRLLKSTRDGGG